MSQRFQIEPVDIVAIEREARRLQAQAMAEGMRTLIGWLRDRLINPAGARTA